MLKAWEWEQMRKKGARTRVRRVVRKSIQIRTKGDNGKKNRQRKEWECGSDNDSGEKSTEKIDGKGKHKSEIGKMLQVKKYFEVLPEPLRYQLPRGSSPSGQAGSPWGAKTPTETHNTRALEYSTEDIQMCLLSINQSINPSIHQSVN